MDNNKLTFELFRYQLLPLSSGHDDDLFPAEITIDQIRESKNLKFKEAIASKNLFHDTEKQLSGQTILDRENWYVFKLAVNKSIDFSPEPFKEETFDNWPYVTVIVNNDPEIQIIAISKNRKAFWSSNVVISALSDALRKPLGRNYLTIQIEAITQKNYFWELIKQYRGKITSVDFELISPNMANITNTLKLDLKKLKQDTNSHRTDLKLNASEGAALEVQDDNEMINSLVDYTERGGGNISLRARGIRNTIKTSTATRTFEADELTVNNLTYEQVEAFLGPNFRES